MRREYKERETYFFNNYFYVDNRVLVPRKKTETLVIKALNELSLIPYQNEKFKLLEVGTGSGAVILSIANLVDRIDLDFIGTDISKDAIDVAKQQNLNKKTQVDYILRDLVDTSDFSEKDIIIANLPYLKRSDNIPEEVREEPKLAVYGGEKGYDPILKLLNIFENKNPKILIFENGSNNIEKILNEAHKTFKNIYSEIYYDNLGEKRGGVIKWL